MPWDVRDLELEHFGYSLPVDSTQSDKTVGTAAVRILNAKILRLKYILTNFGGASVALGLDTTVTPTTGIQLAPGESIEFDWQEDYDTVCEEVWAISAAAGNSIHILEILMTGTDDKTGAA